MEAWIFCHYGGPAVLEWVELPEPLPAKGEIVGRVVTAALNPLDWKRRVKCGWLRKPAHSWWIPWVVATEGGENQKNATCAVATVCHRPGAAAGSLPASGLHALQIGRTSPVRSQGSRRL